MWLNRTRFNVYNVAGLMTTGLTMDTELYVNTGGSNGEYVQFFTKHINVCEFLDNPMSDALAHLITQPIYMNKNNHVMRKCPIPSVSCIGGTFTKYVSTIWCEIYPPTLYKHKYDF